MVLKALKKKIKKYLPRSIIAVRDHWRCHGRFPDLISPRSFNDKVLHRKLFDRRPILSQITDKAGVRQFVEDRLGSQILSQLYYLTTDPETIPFDDLPEKFVIKPTHGSKWVHVVKDKSQFDRAEIIKACKHWLCQNYYLLTGEWAYRDIKPQILVEEFIDDGSIGTPNDYKIFVFGGKAEMIQVDVDRNIKHRRRLHTPDWQKIDVRYYCDDVDDGVPPPVHLKEMIAAAEELAKGFDFLRVDLYDTGKRIYFGELTTTPDNGHAFFTPKEFDFCLGSKWKLPSWPVKRGWFSKKTHPADALGEAVTS